MPTRRRNGPSVCSRSGYPTSCIIGASGSKHPTASGHEMTQPTPLEAERVPSLSAASDRGKSGIFYDPGLRNGSVQRLAKSAREHSQSLHKVQNFGLRPSHTKPWGCGSCNQPKQMLPRRRRKGRQAGSRPRACIASIYGVSGLRSTRTISDVRPRFANVNLSSVYRQSGRLTEARADPGS